MARMQPLLALLAGLAAGLPSSAGQDAARAPTRAAATAARALDPRGLGVVLDPTNDEAFVFDTAQDRVIGVVHVVPNRNGVTDVVIDRAREFAYVSTVGSELFVLDLRGPAPALASGVNPVRLHAIGGDIALTHDQRFVIATGPTGNAWPTSVIDVAARTEAFWANLGIHTAVETCGDGTVLLDSQQGILWLAIDGSGTLTPLGSPLPTGAFALVCEPGGTAVAFVQSELVSFRAGLQEIARIQMPSTTPISSSLAFDASGTRLFVRRAGFNGQGTLELRAYADGQFGAAPDWVVSLPPTTLFQYGIETIAVDDQVHKVYAPRPGGVDVFAMETGVRLATITHPELAFPHGIDVVDRSGR